MVFISADKQTQISVIILFICQINTFHPPESLILTVEFCQATQNW